MSRRDLLRPAGFDDLGLRRAFADRMLPALVAAMAFLAALAIGGWTGAAAVARGWQQGAAASLTIQVPHPEQQADGVSRLDRVLAVLHATPGIEAAHRLSPAELGQILHPWLGPEADQIELPLPAVIAVRLGDPPPSLDGLSRQIATTAPGTSVEQEEVWAQRLARLIRSLQACAGLILAVVAGVAGAVVAVATRGGLAARREAIDIIHGLGATDSYIAGRFARRAARLAVLGGAIGAILALPALLALAWTAAPLSGEEQSASLPGLLPPGLWIVIFTLPVMAGSIGWLTAQATVRLWVRRLP